MKLLEFITKDDMAVGFYDPAADRFNRRHLDDTRKPKLTLRHLNRLKKMRAMRTLEKLKRQDVLDIMYGQPAEDAMGGMPGMGGF